MRVVSNRKRGIKYHTIDTWYTLLIFGLVGVSVWFLGGLLSDSYVHREPIGKFISQADFNLKLLIFIFLLLSILLFKIRESMVEEDTEQIKLKKEKDDGSTNINYPVRPESIPDQKVTMEAQQHFRLGENEVEVTKTNNILWDKLDDNQEDIYITHRKR